MGSHNVDLDTGERGGEHQPHAMADYVYRKTLTEDEALDLHTLYQKEWWTKGRALADVQKVIANSDHVFAAFSVPEGRLAAFARVLTDGVYKALVFDVIVAAAHRRRGLGVSMLSRIENDPGLAGVQHVELYCLPELVPFYEKLGFTTTVSGVALMRKVRVASNRPLCRP